MRYDTCITILNKEISISAPTYFVADIAANHDGSLDRAVDLIYKAKESGADAAKFQHFTAGQIVSDKGFSKLGGQLGHQKHWESSVFDIYKKYECPRTWTETLVATCKQADIHFLTAPYDLETVDLLDEFLPAYKVGSGDITWLETLGHIAEKNKPVLLATGASSMDEVVRAVDHILARNKKLILMQCNTNYTGSSENFKYVNLNVLKAFALKWPFLPLGLSDHTPGHSTVLGAISLGARVIEKHFTDDNNRIGPDHAFALNPETWREMVDRARELEMALGDGIKRVEVNEQETVVLQRRCLRVNKDLSSGSIISRDDIDVLRPAPKGAYSPYQLLKITGSKLLTDKSCGEELFPKDIEEN